MIGNALIEVPSTQVSINFFFKVINLYKTIEMLKPINCLKIIIRTTIIYEGIQIVKNVFI